VIEIPHPVRVGTWAERRVAEDAHESRFATVLGILFAVLAGLLMVAVTGCTAAQKAEWKHAEVVAVADADTLAGLVLGGLTAAQSLEQANPALAQALATQAAKAAGQLATKAGVSAADVATLQADLTDPAKRAAAVAVAAKVKAATATLSAAVTPAPTIGTNK
jgi:hypothetical protein